MTKSRYIEEQVAYALRLAESGTPVADVCHQIGIAEATFTILLTGEGPSPPAASVWLNAILLGTVATMIYLAIVLVSPGGLRAALDIYGTPLFVFSNAMRIAGCLAAPFHILRRRESVASAAHTT